MKVSGRTPTRPIWASLPMAAQAPGGQAVGMDTRDTLRRDPGRRDPREEGLGPFVPFMRAVLISTSVAAVIVALVLLVLALID